MKQATTITRNAADTTISLEELSTPFCFSRSIVHSTAYLCPPNAKRVICMQRPPETLETTNHHSQDETYHFSTILSLCADPCHMCNLVARHYVLLVIIYTRHFFFFSMPPKEPRTAHNLHNISRVPHDSSAWSKSRVHPITLLYCAEPSDHSPQDPGFRAALGFGAPLDRADATLICRCRCAIWMHTPSDMSSHGLTSLGKRSVCLFSSPDSNIGRVFLLFASLYRVLMSSA